MSQAFETIFQNHAAHLQGRHAVAPRSAMLARLGSLLGCRGTGLPLQALTEAARPGAAQLSLDEREDLLIHAATYLGFAYVHSVMAAWLPGLDATERAAVGESRDMLSASPLAERAQAGIALYRVFDAARVPEQIAFYQPVGEDYYAHGMALFGSTFGRVSLSVREREILTVAMLAAAFPATPQLRFHTRVALEQGVSRAELAETLLQVQFHAGLPAANVAATTMLDVLRA
jgi:4-carboxymuconolactone decarboxylase